MPYGLIDVSTDLVELSIFLCLSCRILCPRCCTRPLPAASFCFCFCACAAGVSASELGRLILLLLLPLC